ncbi:adenylosuccinate synthase [bacterium]|nr:adenylosuccinate synthase [bacterium]
MTVKIIVGAQWGDEGKGKITDILAEKVNLVVRYQGGNNAGHTVVVGDKTFKLHLIPSGVLYKSVTCVIANGVVIDPEVMFQELSTLREKGVEITPDQLKISSLAHVILPFHRMLDSKQESDRGSNKIGTTGRGIGPCYTDKIGRVGVRVVDLLNKERLARLIRQREWDQVLGTAVNLDEVIESYVAFGQRIKPYVVDSSLFINEAINSGKHVILEGSQGTMLDIDHGTYPFVTTSNPVSGGACSGAGIGPHKINHVIGVAKAYVTRVGEGPFPTELNDETGEKLRHRGAEFGTTTNRPRRCGWLDLVGLRYAVRVNGFTEICLTKLDVLDDCDSIKVCTAYRLANGSIVTEFPLDYDEFTNCEPIYEELLGWKVDISQITDYDQLPPTAKHYAAFISERVGVPITMISVGSRRHQTIHLLEV